eukprot:scaffold3311_cov411-Prasinococcus_capsulatus_cf.AAC.5
MAQVTGPAVRVGPQMRRPVGQRLGATLAERPLPSRSHTCWRVGMHESEGVVRGGFVACSFPAPEDRASLRPSAVRYARPFGGGAAPWTRTVGSEEAMIHVHTTTNCRQGARWSSLRRQTDGAGHLLDRTLSAGCADVRGRGAPRIALTRELRDALSAT